ncbi:MAG: flippase [Acidobacteriaceae bacterium]
MNGTRKSRREVVQEQSRPGLRRNAAWIFAGQLFSLAVQAIYFAVLARLLGLHEYGLLAGVAAAVSLASQFSSLGAGFVFLRHVSADYSLYPTYFGNLIATCVFVGISIVLVLCGVSRHLLANVDHMTILYMGVSECVFGQLTLGASRVFQAFERMRITALLTLTTNTLRMLLAFFLLMEMHHATARQWAGFSMFVSMVGSAAALLTAFRIFGLPSLSFPIYRARFREGLLFAASSSNTSIFNDIDKVLLGHFGQTAATGLYAMGYRAIEIATLPLRSVHAAAYPRFCQAGAHSFQRVRELAGRILRKTTLLAGGCAIGLWIFAPLVPVVVGKSFAPSVAVIRLLCIIPLLRSFHLCAGDALAGAGLQRYRFWYESAAAAGNVVLNLLLIPRYSWHGAAWASLVTDGSLAIVSWATLRLTLTRQNIAPVLVRGALS